MPSTTTTPKLVIFSDLDGTLLDQDTYSFEKALPALGRIKEEDIPLVLSSSKTRAEIEFYRRLLQNRHPFVSENGGAVFVPSNYFSFYFPFDRDFEGYSVFELGMRYPRIVQLLNAIKKETGIPMKGFSDLSKEDLISLCGFSPREADLAKAREYDEPFLIEGGEHEINIVRKKIEERGMSYTWGGKFHHLLGPNDKGKAIAILKVLYENEFFSIVTVGIGDSLNDLPMLGAVDFPIFLRGEGEIPPGMTSRTRNLTLAEGKGPGAWNEAILQLLDRLRT